MCHIDILTKVSIGINQGCRDFPKELGASSTNTFGMSREELCHYKGKQRVPEIPNSSRGCNDFSSEESPAAYVEAGESSRGNAWTIKLPCAGSARDGPTRAGSKAARQQGVE